MKRARFDSKLGSARLRPKDTEPLWTVRDVSDYLCLKDETVRMMARAGKLPAIKVGRVWRFDAHAIREYVRTKERRILATSAPYAEDAYVE